LTVAACSTFDCSPSSPSARRGRGAILELKRSQMDFQRGVIDFQSAGTAQYLDSGFSKGRTVVPMSALLRVALEEAEAGARTPFVIEWNGSRVADVKTGFIAAVRRAGLQGRRISPHALRRASASWLSDDYLDMRKIERLLGHKSERTTAPSCLPEATNAIGAGWERWWAARGSNSRHPRCKRGALPLS
jgi:integrase